VTGLQISDGIGNAYGVQVDSDHRLHTDTVSRSPEHYINWNDGRAYHLTFSQSPTVNDDCILYLANSSDDDLVVEGFYLYVSATCQVYVKLSDKGTRNSATDLTPVAVNAGSGKTASGDFEKGADLDGGAATLTGGSEVMRWVFTAAETTDFFNFEADVVLPKNETLTIWCNDSTVTVTGVVVFYYQAGYS